MLFGWLSAMNYSRGDSARALECREKFETLCNQNGFNSTRIEYLLGGCYADFGLLQQSEALLRSAIAGEATNPAYHERLGDVLIARRATASGFEEYLIALRMKSTSGALHHKLGMLLEKKGDATGALHHYRKFLLQDSTSTVARHLQERLKRHEP
jgi:tetratricopeptide (TPR) repeat protein